MPCTERARPRRRIDRAAAAAVPRLVANAAAAPRRAPGRVRRPAVPDQARRHLAVSRQPDRPPRAGLPVQQRAQARGGRLVLAGNAGRARPDRGRGRALARRRAGLDRRRAAARCCRSAPMWTRWSTAGPEHPIRVRARPADLRADALHPRPRRRGRRRRSRRGSAARSITSWWRSRCRARCAAGACWASGASTGSSRSASCRTAPT